MSVPRLWGLAVAVGVIGVMLWSVLFVGVRQGWWLPTLGELQGQIVRAPSARYGSARPFRTYGGGPGFVK